jgi:hypothetical protein
MKLSEEMKNNLKEYGNILIRNPLDYFILNIENLESDNEKLKDINKELIESLRNSQSDICSNCNGKKDGNCNECEFFNDNMDLIRKAETLYKKDIYKTPDNVLNYIKDNEVKE